MGSIESKPERVGVSLGIGAIVGGLIFCVTKAFLVSNPIGWAIVGGITAAAVSYYFLTPKIIEEKSKTNEPSTDSAHIQMMKAERQKEVEKLIELERLAKLKKADEDLNLEIKKVQLRIEQLTENSIEVHTAMKEAFKNEANRVGNLHEKLDRFDKYMEKGEKSEAEEVKQLVQQIKDIKSQALTFGQVEELRKKDNGFREEYRKANEKVEAMIERGRDRLANLIKGLKDLESHFAQANEALSEAHAKFDHIKSAFQGFVAEKNTHKQIGNGKHSQICSNHGWECGGNKCGCMYHIH